MLPVADATRAVPTIGAMRGEHAADPLGVDADVGGHLEVHQVRERRRIDGDERSDANQHERLRVETRHGDGVRGHAREQIEDRGALCGFSHGAPFV